MKTLFLTLLIMPSLVLAQPSPSALLDDIEDVDIGFVTKGEILQYDDVSDGWINQTLTEAGIAASSDIHDEVTLSGSGTYLSLAGQVITQDAITESDITDLNHAQLSSSTELLWNEGGDISGISTFKTADGSSVIVSGDGLLRFENDVELQFGTDNDVSIDFNGTDLIFDNGSSGAIFDFSSNNSLIEGYELLLGVGLGATTTGSSILTLGTPSSPIGPTDQKNALLQGSLIYNGTANSFGTFRLTADLDPVSTNIVNASGGLFVARTGDPTPLIHTVIGGDFVVGYKDDTIASSQFFTVFHGARYSVNSNGGSIGGEHGGAATIARNGFFVNSFPTLSGSATVIDRGAYLKENIGLTEGIGVVFDSADLASGDTKAYKNGLEFVIEVDGNEMWAATGSNAMAWNGNTPIGRPSYTVTNLTTDRTYNANSTTIAELAGVLGTLIEDLTGYGLLQ